MSDEQTPPQLRLRPRKRDDESVPTVANPAPAASIPAPSVPVLPPSPPTPQAVETAPPAAPAAEASPLRFRLKPKLSSEPETPVTVVSPEPVYAPVMVQPVAPQATDQGASPEIPRLKLKPLVAQETAAPGAAHLSSAAQAAPPPIFTGSAPFPGIPAFPVLQSLPPMPGMDPSVVPEPMIGGLSPVGEVSDGLPPPLAMPPPLAPPPPPVVVPSPYKSKQKPRRSPAMLVLGGAVVVLLIAGGGAYFVLFKGEPVQSAPSVKPAAPAEVIPKPPVVTIAPLPPPPAPLQSVVAAPNPTTQPSAPVPTPAFRAWVNEARVTGVRSGSSTMAILNGRLARPGDVIDATEGITFEGVDGEQKLLSFRGRNGAVLTKPY